MVPSVGKYHRSPSIATPQASPHHNKELASAKNASILILWETHDVWLYCWRTLFQTARLSSNRFEPRALQTLRLWRFSPPGAHTYLLPCAPTTPEHKASRPVFSFERKSVLSAWVSDSADRSKRVEALARFPGSATIRAPVEARDKQSGGRSTGEARACH